MADWNSAHMSDNATTLSSYIPPHAFHWSFTGNPTFTHAVHLRESVSLLAHVCQLHLLWFDWVIQSAWAKHAANLTTAYSTVMSLGGTCWGIIWFHPTITGEIQYCCTCIIICHVFLYSWTCSTCGPTVTSSIELRNKTYRNIPATGLNMWNV